MRILAIPPKEIKEIKKLMNTSKVEYGGWFEFTGVNPKFSKRKQFEGDELSVSVPIENYEIHWHTHPAYLISSYTFDQTGPFQPPSVDDIAQTSYKYFFHSMGTVLRQVVFTHHAIYIQSPIKSSLDKLKLSLETDEEVKIWTEKWYNPFKKEACKIRSKIGSIGLDLGGYIDEDTGKQETYSREMNKSMYKDSLKLERDYIALAKSYGVKIEKIPNWKKITKEGLEIRV